MSAFFVRRISLAACLLIAGCGDPSTPAGDASTDETSVDASVVDATGTEDADLGDASDAADVCTPEDAHCRGVVPVRCQDGRFVADTACPYVCVDGGCAGECVPGTRECGANETTRTCDVSGHFVTGATCEHVCAAGECAGSCTPGSSECRDGDAYACDASGAWTLDASCPYACVDGACTGECVPGARACGANETTMTCDASGHFVTGVACEHVCVAGECAGSCDPDSTECRDGDAYACGTAGVWSLSSACAYVCTNGACTGECVPGTQRCRGAVPDTCDVTGTWRAGTTCKRGCVDGACLSGCGDGVVDPGEVCDPASGGARTCTSLGYGGAGTYTCTSTCTAVTTACAAWGESFESGSLPSWANGAKPWLISADPRSGRYALRSPPMPGQGGAARVTLTVEFVSGGSFSFWWRIESEPDWDFVYFDVDGNIAAYSSGVQGWTQVTVNVSPGVHTFGFEYVTDSVNHVGADAIWIDDITTVGGRLR